MLRVILAVVCFAGIASAQITTSMDDWSMSAGSPVIENGTLPDASTGDYMSVPVGTKGFYYEVKDEGAGMVEMWVHDAGNCIADPTPAGLPQRGPKWGLQTGSYAWVALGIHRISWTGACQGYSQISSANLYSPGWFANSVRRDNYVGGWYKWIITGTMDAITFDYDDGTATATYDGTVGLDTTWTGVFGSGWKAVYVQGDDVGGNEPIKLHCTAGTGVFAGIAGGASVHKEYADDSWMNVKKLFR